MPQTPNQQVLAAPEPEVLLELQTMFPFDLIPDKVKLTSMSLVVIKRYFLTSQTTTFMLADIMNVELSTALFASTICLFRKMSSLPPYKIRNLRTVEAQQLKNMIQGLMMLSKEQVDVAHANSQQVRQKATTIGAVAA